MSESILDQLTEQTVYSGNTLAADVEVETDYEYTVIINSVAHHVPQDVHQTLGRLHSLFYASHYISGFCIQNIVVPENSRITRDCVPPGIQFIESEIFKETYLWSKFQVKVQFNFRTRFKNPHLTVMDSDEPCAAYGMLRFITQLAKVSGRLLDYDRLREDETKQDISADYFILLHRTDNDYSNFEMGKELIDGIRNDNANAIDLEKSLKRLTLIMDRVGYSAVTSDDYEFAVYRYSERARAWRLKQNGWKTVVSLTPTPTYDKLTAKKNAIGVLSKTEYCVSQFSFNYRLEITGHSIADLYIRYNLLKSVCEFSVFSRLFTADTTINYYADLFWHMSPKSLHRKIAESSSYYEFSNMNYANFVVKMIMDIYDESGYDAVIDYLKEEMNALLLPDKVKLPLKNNVKWETAY